MNGQTDTGGGAEVCSEQAASAVWSAMVCSWCDERDRLLSHVLCCDKVDRVWAAMYAVRSTK